MLVSTPIAQDEYRRLKLQCSGRLNHKTHRGTEQGEDKSLVRSRERTVKKRRRFLETTKIFKIFNYLPDFGETPGFAC